MIRVAVLALTAQDPCSLGHDEVKAGTRTTLRVTSMLCGVLCMFFVPMSTQTTRLRADGDTLLVAMIADPP